MPKRGDVKKMLLKFYKNISQMAHKDPKDPYICKNKAEG